SRPSAVNLTAVRQPVRSPLLCIPGTGRYADTTLYATTLPGYGSATSWPPRLCVETKLHTLLSAFDRAFSKQGWSRLVKAKQGSFFVQPHWTNPTSRNVRNECDRERTKIPNLNFRKPQPFQFRKAQQAHARLGKAG